MTNHPNRNWRTRMHAECSGWLVRWDLPADGASLLTPDQLRDLMRQAYLAGYGDGRISAQPPKKV